ncbi:DNA/RNA non-specific endonuclease [Mucilaginibacter terrae]|nr:DNA/RNA non-specific endonuclease [Mucilaginibacter terrae]
MKLKFLLIPLLASLAFVSCKKDTLYNNEAADSLKVKLAPYALTEDFEANSKPGYAAADINLKIGSWNFDEALVGNLAADAKNGNYSVRLRSGKISMNFDVSGVSQISFKHGKYGSDATVGWQLLISRDGGSTYTQLGADYTETTNALVTETVSIASTGPVRFQFKKLTTSPAASRINLDDITIIGFGNPGVTLSDTDPDDGGSTGGGSTSPTTPRGVTLGADAPPATGDNSNLLFGNPSNATTVSADNFFIDAGYYVESYSKTRGTPNWVSWHIDATNITNAVKRIDNFAGFTGLPTDFYQVQSNSYVNSGFDRGHNCPSGDRTSSTNANYATFLMTNMIPQAPQNNQQTWNFMEQDLRTQITAGNEVYVIMGSYGTGGIGKNSNAIVNSIDNGRVIVPSNVWKVAIIIPNGNGDLIRAANTGSVKIVAVNTPNRNDTNVSWRTYTTTVRDIEAKVSAANGSPFNLFSNLPQNVQDALETQTGAGI